MNKSGIVLVKKPKDISSYDVIRMLKKKLGTKKIGHAGTLDPFACGLLILGINEGTKILPYIESSSKEYIAELTLGSSTDTLDLTGKVINYKTPSIHSYEEVDDALNSFLGEYKQKPPIYSALKLNGKPLYKYARENKEVVIKERLQHIYKVRLINIENNIIRFYVKCDKGTYIRVLGVDLASKLNEVGHLTNLERVGIGPYYILNVKKPECITENSIIDIKDALKIKKIEINDVNKIKNGNPIKLDCEESLVLLTNKDKALAIYEFNKDDKLYHSKRGFRYEDI